VSTDTQTPAQADQGDAATGVHERLPGDRTPLRTFLRYAAMPVFLLVVVLGLYFWVTGQELDSIETRRLTSDILSEQIYQHVWLTVVSTAIVLLLAVPLGILVTRPKTRGLAPYIVNLGNAGQAIPSLGLLALLFFAFREVSALPSTGRVPVVTALVAYSFLPILRNTMVGLDQVDRFMLEAGKGMGMSNMQVLRRIELPLAVPVILAGVRTALVLNVGTATLAFLFGGGGLGQTIFQGFQLRRTPILLTGAILTAVLALLIDYLAGIAEERLTPEGL
jgi:osmoprotectant transport system permease protein